MSRAGQECTEDVKRQIRQVCDQLGLNEKSCQSFLSSRETNPRYRTIIVDVAPVGFAFDAGVIAIQCEVTVNGNIKPLQVWGQATEGDPHMTVFTAPRMRTTVHNLWALKQTLKMILEDQDEILKRGRIASPPSLGALHFDWAIDNGSLEVGDNY